MSRGGAARALHEEVREEIARRIRRGLYKPDTPLPSGASLASEFNVSAITVKRAIRDLQTLGLIRPVPGIANLVRRPQRFIRDLDMALGSGEDAAHRGQTISFKVLDITHRKVDDPVLETFEPPRGHMLNVERLIFADDTAITYDSAFITVPVDSADIEALSTKFIYEVLKKRGLAVKRTRLVIDAAPASAEVQEAFGVPTGFPTLRRAYHHITANPAVAVFGLAIAPFDRLACTVELRPRR